MKKQPLLTHFPSRVFATGKRIVQAKIRVLREQLIDKSLSGYAVLFESVLPWDFLKCEDRTQRRRHFGNLPVFWAWLAQLLEGNAPCGKALGLIQAWCQGAGLPTPAGDTSGYCQARLRLKRSFLEKIAQRTVAVLSRAIAAKDLWYGLQLKAIDGSSVQLMDTAANRAVWPQPSGQKTGCGFPTMGIVGLVNLSHGGWESIVPCRWQDHESKIAQQLVPQLGEGDLLLADRAYCTYELIATLQQRGARVLMRLHQARHRKMDWRKGKKISPTERLVVWKKPIQQPRMSRMSPEQWGQLPESITLRYIKITYRNREGQKVQMVVVTDLLDAQSYPEKELAELYSARWEIEVKLRDVKTTLGMEFFPVKTPQMARKTLLMMTIAYNLVRFLMQQASDHAGQTVNLMSFKGTLDLVTSSHHNFRSLAGQPKKLKDYRCRFIALCATKTLIIRPGREDPRAVKRRPKSYQLLNKPRPLMRPIPHRNRYQKAA